MLDTQAKALLQLMVDRKVPAVNTLPPEQAREFYVVRKALTQPDPPPVSSTTDHGPLLGGVSVPIREYRPAAAQATDSLPALVYFHGGGWVIGNIETHDVLCRQLCQASGCAVFSVDYRLAPEHVFPGAFDDALARAGAITPVLRASRNTVPTVMVERCGCEEVCCVNPSVTGAQCFVTQ